MLYCSRWCAKTNCSFNFTLKVEKKLNKKHPHGFHVKTEDLSSPTCGFIATDTRR